MFVSQQKKVQVATPVETRVVSNDAPAAAAPPSRPNTWLSGPKKSGEEKKSEEKSATDFSQHVIAVIGPTLCMIAPAPAIDQRLEDSPRDPSSTLILTRFNDDFDTGFIRLAGPCGACESREWWIARKTPQQRRQESERANSGQDRYARFRYALHCVNCRPIRVAALSLGRIEAVEVRAGDVMWGHVVRVVDRGGGDGGEEVGRGWVWHTAIEDELMRRADRENKKGSRGVEWWDWPEHDRAMGLKVIEGRKE